MYSQNIYIANTKSFCSENTSKVYVFRINLIAKCEMSNFKVVKLDRLNVRNIFEQHWKKQMPLKGCIFGNTFFKKKCFKSEKHDDAPSIHIYACHTQCHGNFVSEQQVSKCFRVESLIYPLHFIYNPEFRLFQKTKHTRRTEAVSKSVCGLCLICTISAAEV